MPLSGHSSSPARGLQCIAPILVGVLTSRGRSSQGIVSALTLDDLKQRVLEAGLEIYRANGEEIRIAERVRMHLMDSGVTLRVDGGPKISVTIRSQRSDFPTTPAEALLSKVRNALKDSIESQGFRETQAAIRDITDPMDESHVLDVWYELTYSKQEPSVEALVADLRWALAVPKCVTQ